MKLPVQLHLLQAEVWIGGANSDLGLCLSLKAVQKRRAIFPGTNLLIISLRPLAYHLNNELHCDDMRNVILALPVASGAGEHELLAAPIRWATLELGNFRNHGD